MCSVSKLKQKRRTSSTMFTTVGGTKGEQLQNYYHLSICCWDTAIIVVVSHHWGGMVRFVTQSTGAWWIGQAPNGPCDIQNSNFSFTIGATCVIVAKCLEVVVKNAIRARNWSLVLHRSISPNRESLHIYISKHMHTTNKQSSISMGLL